MRFQSNTVIDKVVFAHELDPTVFDLNRKYAKPKRIAILLIIMLCCFFSKYTFVLGFILFLFMVIYFLATKMMIKSKTIDEIRAKRNKQIRLYNSPVITGFDEYGVSMNSE